jgi:hypothetical protein
MSSDFSKEEIQRFRPKTLGQFVVFQIATRFEDLANLPQYLAVAAEHSQEVLLETAKAAERQGAADGSSPPVNFFRELTARQGKEVA